MEEKTMPLKLSEAIRLGAALKPQGFNHLYRDGKTCAMGAAWDAVGRLGSRAQEWPEQWRLVATKMLHVRCPFQPCDNSTRITHLNDDHRLTREQIADIVESLETQSPAGEKANLKVEDEVGEVCSK